MPVRVPVEYDTDASGLEKDLANDTKTAGSRAGKSFGGAFRSSAKGLLAGAGLLVGLNEVKGFLGDSIDEARESQKVGAATDLLVKKLGKSAGVTAGHMGDLANQISKNVGLDDELIQTGENVLLGFKNIRNEVGKGNQVFDRATAAAVDLSATPLFKGNLTAATKALGKALADPEKGLTALGRVGIKFSATQTDLIKKYAKAGDALKAQKIILGEVEARYKGTAASQATASEKAGVAIKNLEEQIGLALLPTIDDLADFVSSKVVPSISQLVTEFQEGKGTGGEIRDVFEDVGDALGHILDGGKAVLGFFAGLPSPVKKTGVELLIAYAALSKVQAVMTAVGGSGAATFVKGLRNGTTSLSQVADKSNAFGASLRTLAGAGGLLALQNSLGQTNRGLGDLEGALGGAAVGFAVGGPLGAGVGAVGGLLLNVFHSGQQAATGIELSRKAAQSAAGDLESLSDSITDVTKGYDEIAKQQIAQAITKALGGGTAAAKSVSSLGLTIQDLTNAALNVPGAMEKVQNATDQAGGAVLGASQDLSKTNQQYLGLTKSQRDAAIAAGDVIRAFEALSPKLKQERADSILAQLATKDLGKTLAGIPTDTIVRIGTEGALDAKNDIATLINTAHLTPKQIRVLLETAGLPHAKEDIDALRNYANGLDGKTVHVTLLTSIKRTDALGLGSLPPRAAGGPVRAGNAYLVGERRPEVFVPNQSGRILPKVPTVASSAPGPAPIMIIQNDYGPTTSRAKIQDLTWALRYSTNARQGRV